MRLIFCSEQGAVSVNEKQAMERATADAFIELYNREMGTSFSIIEYSDAPDIRCKDREGNVFNIEVTLTEDREGDISSALGRSNGRSLEALVQHVSQLKAGKADPLEKVSCLSGNVRQMIVKRILAKLDKDYGSNVALVVRDSSPLCWDWESELDDIKSLIASKRNPFDKGIWILSYCKDKIYRIT